MSDRATGPREGVGSLGEEAAKLARALQEALGAGAEDAGAPGAQERPSLLGELTGPECEICPICQLLATLRRTRPEVFQHLSDAAHSLLAAAREAVVPPGPGDASAPSGAARTAGSGVERIDVR